MLGSLVVLLGRIKTKWHHDKSGKAQDGVASVSQQSDHKTGMGRKTALGIGGGLAALAIAGAVSGCSSSTTSSPASSTTSSASSTGDSSGAAPVATSSASAVAATGDGPFAFGKTFSTGTETITVSTPTKFTPSSAAAGYTSGDEAYYVTVTVGNTGTQPLDVTLLQVSATMGTAGIKAANIIDSASSSLGAAYGSSTPFVTPVAAGTATTGEVAFDVPAAQASKFTISIVNLTAHAEWTGSLS